MIQTVYCDGCGKDGALPIVLRYQYDHNRCGECGHFSTKEFVYYFCSLNCLAPFIKERFNEKTSVLTLPCRIEWHTNQAMASVPLAITRDLLNNAGNNNLTFAQLTSDDNIAKLG